MAAAAVSALRSRMFLARPAARLGMRRSMAIDAKVVRYSRHGAPASVLSVDTDRLSEDLKSNQVLVKMLAAPITPNDFAQIKGFGSVRPDTDVAGNEGVGVVVSVGDGVSDLKADDWVVPAAPGLGTWRTHLVTDRKTVARVDAGGVSPEVASTAVVAPATARRLLEDFATLNEGDVIIQNNAGSTVGQAVIQLAAAKGVKTINIMRHRGDWNDLVNHYHGLGATIVVNEEFARSHEFDELVSELPKPKLGLNSVGGKSCAAVANALGEGATLVTFGGVSADSAATVPVDALVGNDITVKGFSLARWMESVSVEERDAAIAQAMDDARTQKVEMLLAREPFKNFEHALARSQQAGERKVVLVM